MRPSARACLELGKTFNNLPVEQVTAFTATASPLILGKIQDYLLKDRSFNLVRANPDRVNIHYEVRPVLSRTKGLEDVLKTAERPLLYSALHAVCVNRWLLFFGKE